MADEIVDVVIRPDGKVEMHVTGVDGTACVEHTDQLVGLLGGEVESQELTADAYVQTEADTAVDEQNRLWH
ncbi:DUF2997 domain-containing protein [Dactylosporangium matsuzakiense]|uniref:DUF2997 domain-containing protein n=1 Tax=Dactylosporangium matsuzakiense TaxID=53360 RepID=UPI0021C2B20E|nr:DUF2997 domain-containing protein [Dactylosporangium matsuzakiense]UWZ47909.1 DUF2997 domain-containing protein [Dactylosporangium matsuzakiense]